MKNISISVPPIGISMAPLVFTKSMKVPMSFPRRIAIHLVVYLDDIPLIKSIGTTLSVRGTDSFEAIRTARLSNKQNQLSSDTVSRNGIFEVYPEHSRNGIITSITKKSENLENVHQIQSHKQNISSEFVRGDRQFNSFNSSYFSTPLHYRHLQMGKKIKDYVRQ